MKKIIITLIIILSFCISFVVCKEKPGNKDTNKNTALIDAKSGLKLRAKPNQNGKHIVTIPYKQKVQIIKEKRKSQTIAGRTGKWTKVKWKTKSGWVFGGFLKIGKSKDKTKINLPKKFIGIWECGEYSYNIKKDHASWFSGTEFSGKIGKVIKKGKYYSVIIPYMDYDESITIYDGDKGIKIDDTACKRSKY
jgi:hypothetical protein